MKIRIISFTEQGEKQMISLYRQLHPAGEQVSCYSKGFFEKSQVPHFCPIQPIGKLKKWAEESFACSDALIFISACGIAVRSIAPYVADKFTDPAVIVMDEQGKFVISLLSGHMGGANDLAKRIADYIGATPVISTATDLSECFAVDLFAKEWRLWIDSRVLAKEVSASLLRQNETGDKQYEVGVVSDFLIRGNLPKGLVYPKPGQRLPLGICISCQKRETPFEKTLYLIPKRVWIGIGCKKNTSFEKIEKFVFEKLQQCQIPKKALEGVASIDLKSNETGLIDFCRAYSLPFFTFTAEELEQVKGDFTESSFVASVTGVSNVCERAAKRAVGQGSLIMKKTAGDGVTIAAAVKEWSVKFE